MPREREKLTARWQWQRDWSLPACLPVQDDVELSPSHASQSCSCCYTYLCTTSSEGKLYFAHKKRPIQCSIVVEFVAIIFSKEMAKLFSPQQQRLHFLYSYIIAINEAYQWLPGAWTQTSICLSDCSVATKSSSSSRTAPTGYHNVYYLWSNCVAFNRIHKWRAVRIRLERSWGSGSGSGKGGDTPEKR